MELKDLKDLKIKDKVVIDGMKRELFSLGGKLKIRVDGYWKTIEECADKIEKIEIYTPTISFGGSHAYIDEYALNEEKALVYLKIKGQEQHVRSISSVIMQGIKSVKDDYLFTDEIRDLRILSSGNKRIIQSFGDGIVDCIIYNYEYTSGQKRKILIGEDEKEVYLNFIKWLKSSVKYPTLKENNEAFFDLLKNRNLIKKAESSKNILVYYIADELIENDFEFFRDIQLSLIEKVDKVELANSTYLSREQVETIYEKLKTLPDTYETDGQEIKSVGLKLFGGPMTYYVVEANKGDEYYNPYERCFGYVKNESCPECSEWGYFSIREILETKIPVKMSINGMGSSLDIGYEMDLYFDNKLINSDGEILDK